METISGLPLLDIYITGVAMNYCYCMTCTGGKEGWKSGGAHIGHTHILDMMGAEIPITSMCGDITVPHGSFCQGYQSKILAKEQWKENKIPVIPEGAIAVFTDGSREPRGTGAGIFFNGLL